MNNIHLVPQIIIDLADKLNAKGVSQNEFYNYQIRLEAIEEFCRNSLTKANRNDTFRKYPPARKK